MNLSLKNRVSLSFVIANVVVLVLGFTVVHFLNSLNSKMDQIVERGLRIDKNIDLARISTIQIVQYQTKFIETEINQKDIKGLEISATNFEVYLKRLGLEFEKPALKEKISNILGYIDSIKLLLEKTRVWDKAVIKSIGELVEKTTSGFNELSTLFLTARENDKTQLKDLLEESKKNMLLTFIITFLGALMLFLIMPGKIALPFKKIKDAIRELQNANFDVSIFYNANDEIGEIAHELNKMIGNMKVFDELRIDRISMENRKFDLLAGMVKKNLLIVNSEGVLTYMNNSMYTLMECGSEDVINKNIQESILPERVVEIFSIAIKRRTKIENEEVSIYSRSEEADTEESEEIYNGYANVFPIRGKESSLDYYLMVLSKEVTA